MPSHAYARLRGTLYIPPFRNRPLPKLPPARLDKLLKTTYSWPQIIASIESIIGIYEVKMYNNFYSTISVVGFVFSINMEILIIEATGYIYGVNSDVVL